MPSYQYTSKSSLGPVWAMLVLLTQLLTGCDNPACVFGPTGCQGSDGSGGGGGAGEAGLIANPPQDGERLTPSAPEVTAFFPGNGAPQETPVVLIFSESMDPAGVAEAFELVQESPDPSIPDFPKHSRPPKPRGGCGLDVEGGGLRLLAFVARAGSNWGGMFLLWIP